MVIKIGSSVIADAEGNIDSGVMQKIVSEVAGLMKAYRVILVSSGAVSSGKIYLKNYKGKLIERKAAAAIGNPLLIREYGQRFAGYNITVAQALCERHHFSHRSQFLQLKETIAELWTNEVLTIVNENDIVSDHELKFSDNDELATLIAVAFNAEVMILCTTAGGYRDDNGNIIPSVDSIDGKALAYLRTGTSPFGTGGMASKLTFTRLATSLGIKVVMCGIEEEHAFTRAIAGTTGTSFKAKQSTLKDRQKWLASGSITIGSVLIDRGAYEALINRKSLLAIGITKVQRPFSAGEVVELIEQQEGIIGVAKMRLASTELETQTKLKNVMAAHANDIVIF